MMRVSRQVAMIYDDWGLSSIIGLRRNISEYLQFHVIQRLPKTTRRTDICKVGPSVDSLIGAYLQEQRRSGNRFGGKGN